MKILIAYYSKSGNTEKLAKVIKQELENRGHSVDMEKIQPVQEHSFFSWWHIRTIKGECDIQSPIIKDVSEYDVVCVGSPNWTRLSLPVARYLQMVEGLKYKNIGFFATTAAPPPIEWYIFSAYLLDFTLARIIERKGGRIIGNILLSSIFKKWGVYSEYGKKNIKRFCSKIDTPIRSLKEYILDQEELKGIRLLILLFSTSFVFSLVLHIVLLALGKSFINWFEYAPFITVFLFTFIILLVLREREQGVHLAKYFAGAAGVIAWSLAVLLWRPLWGGPLISGYVLFFIIISFFRDLRAVLFTGFMGVLCYGYLFFNHPVRAIFVLRFDLILFFLCLGVVGFITQNLRQHFISLVETQEEMETARNVLEIKIESRTKELERLAESLDEQVKEKTKELQNKLEELERFNRLAIGRELRMIELKEEIKKLKEELKKVENENNVL